MLASAHIAAATRQSRISSPRLGTNQAGGSCGRPTNLNPMRNGYPKVWSRRACGRLAGSRAGAWRFGRFVPQSTIACSRAWLHGFERVEIGVGPQHEDAVELLLLLDLIGINREVLTGDRLQVAPKAGVADQRITRPFPFFSSLLDDSFGTRPRASMARAISLATHLGGRTGLPSQRDRPRKL